MQGPKSPWEEDLYEAWDAQSCSAPSPTQVPRARAQPRPAHPNLVLSAQAWVTTKGHVKAIRVLPEAYKTMANKGLAQAKRRVWGPQKGQTES